MKNIPATLSLVIPAEFGPRAVTLNNGALGLRAAVETVIEEPHTDPDRPVIDFIASTERLDRYQEILSASGWRLAAYRRNPVFQNCHQYGDILFTLGKALITEVRDGKLFQRIEFATGVNPVARIAYGLYRGRFLNAVSVGFIPIRWENGTEQEPHRRKFLEQELVEVSAVGIPANPEALQLGLKAGALDRADLQAVAELCRESLAASPLSDSNPFGRRDAVPGDAPASAHPAAEHLLNLARCVRQVMRQA